MKNQTAIEKVEAFFRDYPEKASPQGSCIVSAGDAPPGVINLIEGRVKMYSLSSKGKEVILNQFKPHAFFPMSWAMNDTPNPYYYEAATDIRYKVAPKEKVIGFLQQNPDVVFDLLQRVYRGTDGLLLRLGYVMAGNTYANIITELLIAAKRFGQKDGDNIVLSLNQQDLADNSGMTRETVNREIKKLKVKGLVETQLNQVVIPDLEQLEAELLNVS